MTGKLTPEALMRQLIEPLLKGGSEAVASVAAVNSLLNDTDTRDKYLDAAIEYAVWHAIRRIRRDVRTKAWTQAAAPDNTDGLHQLAQRNSLSLLDFPLPGGLLMGDAVAEDLKTAHKYYVTQAGSYVRNAKWMKKILDAVGTKTVRDALTHEKLLEFQREVQNV